MFYNKFCLRIPGCQTQDFSLTINAENCVWQEKCADLQLKYAPGVSNKLALC